MSCFAAQPILSTLVPALIKALRSYRKAVLGGKYYWAHRNPQFLGLVYETALPEDDGRGALVAWGERYEYNCRVGGHPANYYVEMARTPKPTKVKKIDKPSKEAKKTTK